MITIILTPHNRQEPSETTLASIHTQTYTDWELIVADRNQGLAQAQGQWVTFIDDYSTASPSTQGDTIDPDYLHHLMQAAHDTQADLILTGYETPDHRQQLPNIAPQHYTSDNLYLAIPTLEIYRRTTPAAALYKTSIISTNNIRFNPQLHQAEDSDFLMRYYLHADSLAAIPFAEYHQGTPIPTIAEATDPSALSLAETSLHEKTSRYEQVQQRFPSHQLLTYKVSLIQHYLLLASLIPQSWNPLTTDPHLRQLRQQFQQYYTPSELTLYKPADPTEARQLKRLK